MLWSNIIAGFCLLLPLTRCAYYEEMAQKYAGDQGLWMAGYNEYFGGMSLEQVKKMMGTKLEQRPGTPLREIQGNFDALPSFSSAENWPQCATTINYIKDQGQCGSCWAVAASEIAADRTCIANTNSSEAGLNETPPLVSLSALDMMSCCDSCLCCGDGCQGGYPMDSMSFWCSNGLVTGGSYGSNCGCQPYPVSPCGGYCAGPEAICPQCSKQCRPGYPISFDSDRHKCTDHYQIANGESGIMNEIAHHGPVECAFHVYENFVNYKSGIYNTTEGSVLGGHGVKIVGWGTDQSDNKYWIINNSWNVTWGMNGVFWFQRGTNLCSMEESCVAGLAETDDHDFELHC